MGRLDDRSQTSTAAAAYPGRKHWPDVEISNAPAVDPSRCPSSSAIARSRNYCRVLVYEWPPRSAP